MLTKNQLAKHNQTLDLHDDAARRQTLEVLLKQSAEDWNATSEEFIEKTQASLLALLAEPEVSGFVRQQIITLLGHFGALAGPAVPTLVKFLERDTPEAMREATARALGKIGKPAHAASKVMVTFLTDSKPRLALEILIALRLIGDASRTVREALLAYWYAPNLVANQAEAALTLCSLKIECPSTVPFLINLLVDSKGPNLRKLAADALGTFDRSTPGVAPALLMTIIAPGKDETVPALATESLARLGCSLQEAFEECAAQLKSSPSAEAALRSPHPLAVGATIGALSLRDKKVREKAIQILAQHGDLAIEAAPALRKFLKSDERNLKLAAAKSLWHIAKDTSAIDALIELLSDAPEDASEDERRQFLQTVIEALWRAGAEARRAIDPLSRLVKDPNRHIRESAQRALASIQQPVAPAR